MNLTPPQSIRAKPHPHFEAVREEWGRSWERLHVWSFINLMRVQARKRGAGASLSPTERDWAGLRLTQTSINWKHEKMKEEKEANWKKKDKAQITRLGWEWDVGWDPDYTLAWLFLITLTFNQCRFSLILATPHTRHSGVVTVYNYGTIFPPPRIHCRSQ